MVRRQPSPLLALTSLACIMMTSHGHDPSIYPVTFVNRGNCMIDQGPKGGTYRSRINSVKTNSPLGCARMCSQDEECVGFNHPGNINTPGTKICTLRRRSPMFKEDCLHTNSSVSDSPTPEIGAFYQKRGTCHNQAPWVSSSDSCYCAATAIWVGEYCSSVPVACDDFVTAGYPDALLSIGEDPFGAPYSAPTACSLDLASKMSTATFAKFQKTSVAAFNRSWSQMENGFKDGEVNLWVGLKAIRYHVEKVKHKATTLRVIFDQRFEQPFVFEYYGVRIGDASDDYRLSFSRSALKAAQLLPSESSLVADCLREANGARFSTYDHDVDDDVTDNCALLSSAPFWYKSCRPQCQPLAVSFNASARQLFYLSQFRSKFLDLSGPHFWAGNFQSVFIKFEVSN